VNYGLTALLVTALYFALFFSDIWPQNVVLWSLVAFCALFPMFFFRYARSLWSAMDLYFDPPRADEFEPLQDTHRDQNETAH
jgi:hypothetical protein